MTRARIPRRRQLAVLSGSVVTVCVAVLAAVFVVQARPLPKSLQQTQPGQNPQPPSAISYEPVPADEWPPAAAADMREIQREDWNAWMQELGQKRLPPARLNAWQWHAEFSAESRALSGEFQLEISRSGEQPDSLLLPLGEFSAAISGSQLAPGIGHARWIGEADQQDEPAILGNQPDGQLAMLVDRDGVATFTAIQQATASSSESFQFKLNLPQASRRAIRLQLPVEFHPQLNRNAGIVIPLTSSADDAAQQSNQTRLWDVLLSAEGPITLRIEKSQPSAATSRVIPVIRREQTEYQADRMELIIRSRWEMRFPSFGVNKLHVHVPAHVALRSLTASDSRLRWRPVTFESIADLNQSLSLLADDDHIEDWQAFEIEVPRDWGGETIALEAIAVAPLALDQLFDLPRLVFSDAFWQSGTAQIQVRRPLNFSDLDLADALCVSGLQDNQIDLQLLDPLAEIQLAVQRRRQQPSAALATRLTLENNALAGLTLLQFSRSHSPPRELELAVSSQWQVTGVVLGNSGEGDSAQELTWRQAGEIGSSAGGQITVDLADQELGLEGFSLLVSTARNSETSTAVTGAAITPVRPLQTDVIENVLLLPPAGKQRGLQITGLDQTESADAFWQRSRLLAEIPGQRVFDMRAINSNARLSWQTPPRSHSVSLDVDAELRDGQLFESFELRNIAAVSREQLLVFVTESRENATVQWTDSQNRPVIAQQVARDEQFAAILPPSGELWRIELNEDLLQDQILIGTRSSAVSAQATRIGLLAVLDAPAHRRGELLVTAPQGTVVAPRLEVDSSQSVLPLWPMAEDFDESESDDDLGRNVARFSYQPAAVLAPQVPVVEIANVPAGQDSPAINRLRQPLIWRETLLWSLHTTGDSMCLSACDIQLRQSRRFGFTLPANATLVDVQLNDQSLTWTQDGRQFTLDLPRGPTFGQLRIRYSLAGRSTGLANEQGLPWIDYQIEVLSRSARLHLPHDLRVAHAEHLPSASLIETIAGRLLGPLTRRNQLTSGNVTRREISAAASQLVRRFAEDVITTHSEGRGERRNLNPQTMRHLLTQVAMAWQKDDRQLLVDAAAMGRDGWLPGETTSSQAVNSFPRIDQEHTSSTHQLALAILDANTLVVTTRDGILKSGLNWRREDDLPIFQNDWQSSPRATAWRDTLVHPAAWVAPTASPWRAQTHSAANSFNGEAVYVLPGSEQSITLANVSQQGILNGFALAIAAVLGWIMCRQHTALVLVLALCMAALSLIAPVAWATIFSGLPLAFVGGALVGFVANNGARLSAVGGHLAVRLRPRSAKTVATVFVASIFLASLANGEPSAPHRAVAASQDPPTGTQSRGANQVVYFMIDESGEPAGETIFASDELVAATLARLDEIHMRPRGYLLSAAQHRLALVDTGIFARERLHVALSFTVHALEPIVNVRLPLRRDDFQVATPQAFVTPLGRDATVTWMDSEAQLTLQGTGEHNVEFDLIADESRTLPGEPLPIALPPVANTSVEIGTSDRLINNRQIRIVSPFARIREFPLAGFSMVTLGPLPELQLNVRANISPSANDFSTEILSWLRISNNQTRLTSRLILSDSDTIPTKLTVQIPASVMLDEVFVDGRVVTSSVSRSAMSTDLDASLLSVPLRAPAAGEVTVDFEFSLNVQARHGQLRFPRVRVQGAQAPVELWAISTNSDLQIAEKQRRQVIDVSRDEFLESWGTSTDVDAVVRPVNTNAEWHLSVLPPSGSNDCVEESVATLRNGKASYEYAFEITPNATPTCTWRAKLPDALTVDNVSVTDVIGDLLGHWAIRGDQLVIFASRLGQGPIQIEVEASQAWPAMPPFLRPPTLSLEGVSVVSSSLRVYCEHGIQTDFAEPVVPISPAEGPSQTIPGGTYLAGAFALAPGVNPPRVSLSEKPAEVDGQFTTRLRRRDGDWQASVRFEQDAVGVERAPQTLLVPRSWKVMEVSPASCRVQSLASEGPEQTLRLSWHSSAAGPEGERLSWEFTFTVEAAALHDFAIPRLELPSEAIGVIEQQFIVPRASAAAPLKWETQSAEENEDNSTTQANPSERVFQITGADARASLTEDSTTSDPVVSLVIAQTSLDPDLGIVATYFLRPHGESHISFQIPSGMNLLQVEINGLPAQTRVTPDGVCKVQLFSNSQPQRLGLCLVGKQDGNETARIPEPIGLAIQETIWIEAADTSATSSAAQTQRLPLTEISKRIQAQLDIESLSWEATSSLAQALLSREVRGTGDTSTNAFWPVQACTTDGASPLRVGHSFSGPRLEFPIARTIHERATWPRWVLAFGLLAAAAIAWPHAQEDARAFAAIKRRLQLPLMLVISGVCLLVLGAWLTGSAALIAGVAWSTAALLKRGRAT